MRAHSGPVGLLILAQKPVVLVNKSREERVVKNKLSPIKLLGHQFKTAKLSLALINPNEQFTVTSKNVRDHFGQVGKLGLAQKPVVLANKSRPDHAEKN